MKSTNQYVQPNQSKRHVNLFVFTLKILSFFTININPLPFGGEYTPILFVVLMMLLFIKRPTLDYNLYISLLLSVIVFSSSVILLISNKDILLNDLLRIIIPCFFLAFGYKMTEVFKKTISVACLFIIMFHFFLLMVFIFNISLLESFGNLVGFRTYYLELGRNIFLSSEPSYAAINLFFAYILYLIIESDKHKIKFFKTSTLIVVLCLFSTESLTGLFFVISILFFGLRKIYIFVLIFILSIIFFYLGDYLRDFSFSYGRVEYVMESLINGLTQNTNLGDWLISLTIIEESIAWRLLSNLSCFFVGIQRFIGLGSINSGLYLHLIPIDIMNAIDVSYQYNRGTFDKISSNSIIPSFTMHLGIVGFFIIGYTTMKSIRGFLEFKKCARKNLFRKKKYVVYLSIIYILFGAFWQSALTSPGWWIILSIGFSQIIVRKKSLSNEKRK